MLLTCPRDLMVFHATTQITSSTPLFLYNFESKSIRGVFYGTGGLAQRNIEDNAWRSSRKKFPAQVPFA